MKERLTNEEIARVFAMYLGCNTIVEKPVVNSEEKKLIASSLEDDGVVQIHFINGGHYKDGDKWYPTTEVKLLLTPLSEITDEHKNELGELINGLSTPSALDYAAEKWIETLLQPSNNKRYVITNIFAYQHLIQQGYAVPLFFGVNHWANGKNAIELRLAIKL